MGRRLERMYQDLESGRMASQFEQSHYSNNAEKLKDVVFLFEIRQQDVKIERQRCNKIYDVDWFTCKSQFTWTDNSAYDELHNKPRIANTFNVKKCLVRLGSLLVQHPRHLARRPRGKQRQRLIGRRRDTWGPDCDAGRQRHVRWGCGNDDRRVHVAAKRYVTDHRNSEAWMSFEAKR